MTDVPLPMIEISGPPRERGEQYGGQAASQVAKSIDFYRRASEDSAGLDWEQSIARAMTWLPRLEEYAPDLVDEMRGTADGAGVDFGDIMMLNLRSELLYDPTFAAMPEIEGCTSFSIAPGGDGHVYTGQNWDWRAGVEGSVVIVRIEQAPKPTLIMMVEAGQLMRHGANSAGIALQGNGLGGRFSLDSMGLPQTMIRRRALEQESIERALKVVVDSRPHIAGNNLLTDRSGFSIDIESTPESCGWMYPSDGLLVHGNHYQAYLPTQLAPSYRPPSVDSLIRVPRATEGLRAAMAHSDPQRLRSAVKDAMSDHLGYPESVCTHPTETEPEVKQALTLTSSIVDLTTGEYRITNGTPCAHGYALLPWDIYDGPAGRPQPAP